METPLLVLFILMVYLNVSPLRTKNKREERLEERLVYLRELITYHYEKKEAIMQSILNVMQASIKECYVWKIQANGMEFQYILIHTGNTDEHTMGCLLLNYSVDANSYIGANSGGAYKALYPEIANALHNGEEVTITYTDIEEGR